MMMNGARALIESLKNENVEVVFGYPGGKIVSLYDALYLADFPHILTRHEQGAAHAADGYARSTGKVGVCIATSGPGATNLVTGIATAYMDSTPMVAITGQAPTRLIGKDSFQEVDFRGISTPITKHNYLVKNVQDLPKVIKEAFFIAKTGRPGPVVIDIAADVFDAALDYRYPKQLELRGYKQLFAGDVKVLRSVVEELNHTKKPLLLLGGGVIISDTSSEIRRFLNKTGIPVTSSLMGLGAVPFSQPLYLGMIGMHGSYAANMAVSNCDLLLGIGVRFDDRVTSLVKEFAPKAKIVHFDIDPAEVNKNIRADLHVISDLKWSLPNLLAEIEDNEINLSEQWRDWQAELKQWQEFRPFSYEKRNDVIMPQQVIETVSEKFRGEAIVVTDVGQHQMWVAQFYKFFQERTFLTSGGLGTMGFGLPAAIGAQIGNPHKPVVLFAGDGGIMMNCQEMATVADLNLPLKILVMNNGVLGMVAQWQRIFYGGRLSHTTLKGRTDLVKLAQAMGLTGLRVTDPQNLRGTLEKVWHTEGPVLVDIAIPANEDVLPMVPAGASLDQMIYGG
ncbi:MAG TPA: biosynthetic-type acetolactate synthase large subunit [Desulfitobacteriaceae bacterium]|nr:biosynthetic-type acetolactate synthase large subunit [Desulfitobacteriaceae bacterium]